MHARTVRVNMHPSYTVCEHAFITHIVYAQCTHGVMHVLCVFVYAVIIDDVCTVCTVCTRRVPHIVHTSCMTRAGDRARTPRVNLREMEEGSENGREGGRGGDK